MDFAKNRTRKVIIGNPIYLYKEALSRYYLGKVSGAEDSKKIMDLLDSAGIGPNVWSLDGSGLISY